MANIVKDIKKYVFDLLQDELPSSIIYHNFTHTSRVVKKLKLLIEGESVSDKDANLLIIAAWFHDTGYTVDIKNHEIESVKIARSYLDGKLNEEEINLVESLILSTKMGYKPKTPLECIMKDADNSHLASKNYEKTSELLKEELKLTGTKTYTDLEWKKGNIEFLTHKHQFFTPFAHENWQAQKQNQLLKLIKAVEKLEQEQRETERKLIAQKEKEEKGNIPEKGIETMFRITLRNHIKLSDIADTKANILLSVNAIIISVALSSLVPRLDNIHNAHLIFPTILLILFSVISIIFAIQSTRPKVTEGKFTKQDVENKKVNLLFFGNFHQVKLDEFTWAMKTMMKDKDYLYDSMTKDLYFLGAVLHKKYKLLRITYTIFTIGIIITVLAFAISFKFMEPHLPS
ncbi:MAG: Pycsar system effector family protein [Flavobacteriales bacterium]